MENNSVHSFGFTLPMKVMGFSTGKVSQFKICQKFNLLVCFLASAVFSAYR